jgi:hydrogenase small subunit
LWLTTGLSCDGDSVAMTAASNPSIEDILGGVIPGMPQVVLHNQLLAYEVGDAYMQASQRRGRQALGPMILIVEGSIGNEQINGDGHWTGLGFDPSDGQPIAVNDWVDRLATMADVVAAFGTCAI